MTRQQFTRIAARTGSKLGTLLLLFQRAPLLRVILPEVRFLQTFAGNSSAHYLITAVAGLGAYDSVAGATTVTQAAPSASSATVPVTSGVALAGVFQIVGAGGHTPQSWSVSSGTLPTGLTLSNAVGKNATLTGTTTVTGNRSVTIRAWENSNFTGRYAQGAFTIAVAANPAAAIATHPAAVTINRGATATLTVTASGTAPLTYQWYQGNKGVTTTPVGTNSATFTTPALTATTNYWVKVTNASNTTGAQSNAATVTVNQPAAITTHPASVTIDSGATTTLAVTASGTGPLTYQWYQGASGVTTAPVGTNLATFTTPALSANASYWVRVTNVANPIGALSNTTTITVRPPYDTWKNARFTVAQLADAMISGDGMDPDRDGTSNLEEYLFGSQPLAAERRPQLTINRSGNSVVISFPLAAAQGPGYAGLRRHAALEKTASLVTPAWSPVTGYADVIGSGQTVTTTLERTAAVGFYRLRVWLAP